MRNLRLLAAATVSSTLLLAPLSALAQQPSDFDRTTARALGKEGHVALDRQDYATAADRFSRAEALVHAPTFLLGLAQAQVGLGKLVSALEIYNRILREGLPPNPPPAFTRALKAAQKEFETLSTRIPYVTIEVAGPGAAAAKVSIDGVSVPTAALGVKRAVDPGKHMIRAAAEGFRASERVLVVGEGQAETVTLEINPPQAEPPAPRAVTPPPPPPPSVPPPVDVKPPPVELAQGGNSARKTLGIAGMAVGGAGLGFGLAMGGVVIAKHGDLLKSCPGSVCPPENKETIEPKLTSYRAFSAVATTGVVVGGVVAAAGVVLFATASRTTAVTVGPGWVGVQGRF